MKNIITILSIIILYTFAAKADIIYTDIIPDSTVAPIGEQYQHCFNLDLDNSKDHSKEDCDYVIAHNNASTQFGGPYVDIFCSYNSRCDLVCNDSGLFIPLDKDDMINKNSKSWKYNKGISINTSKSWIGAKDKYIGLRIVKGSSWYYGWARMDIPKNQSCFIIKDYAFNNTPNEGILAGQKSSSSSVELSNENSYIIIPNPANDYICISNNTYNKIEIYSLSGVKILDSNYQEKIDIRSLVPNVYIVKIDDETCKFIKK